MGDYPPVLKVGDLSPCPPPPAPTPMFPPYTSTPDHDVRCGLFYNFGEHTGMRSEECRFSFSSPKEAKLLCVCHQAIPGVSI